MQFLRTACWIVLGEKERSVFFSQVKNMIWFEINCNICKP